MTYSVLGREFLPHVCLSARLLSHLSLVNSSAPFCAPEIMVSIMLNWSWSFPFVVSWRALGFALHCESNRKYLLDMILLFVSSMVHCASNISNTFFLFFSYDANARSPPRPPPRPFRFWWLATTVKPSSSRACEEGSDGACRQLLPPFVSRVTSRTVS